MYPPLTPELLALKMRLLPLRQVEMALLDRLTHGHSGIKNEAPDDEPNPAEVSINSAIPWKNAFSRIMNNLRSSVDGPVANEPPDSREARELLYACAEDMVSLWNDPTVKRVLKVHRLRVEDLAGL